MLVEIFFITLIPTTIGIYWKKRKTKTPKLEKVRIYEKIIPEHEKLKISIPHEKYTLSLNYAFWIQSYKGKIMNKQDVSKIFPHDNLPEHEFVINTQFIQKFYSISKIYPCDQKYLHISWSLKNKS